MRGYDDSANIFQRSESPTTHDIKNSFYSKSSLCIHYYLLLQKIINSIKEYFATSSDEENDKDGLRYIL